jgi:predicted permease
MDTFWQDARYAVRSYMKTPIFTATVILILALGMGANTAIFSIVNAVLLRPLDFPAAASLVSVRQASRSSGRTSLVSPPNFFDLREQAHSLVGLAAYWSPELTISGDGSEPQKILAATCSDDLFAVLGVVPVLGRPLLPGDGVPGARRVTVLGHGMWQRRFGGDPRTIGQEILLDGMPTQVVGVMPAGVDFPAAGTELWVPLRLSRTQPPNPAIAPEAYRDYRILSLVGRLRPGVTLQQSGSELEALAAHLERSFPGSNHDLTLAAAPLQDAVVGPVKPALRLLFAAVGSVLLIACANVGGLLLVRASTRAREVTLRMALGAGRARLIRQALTESVMLALAGGALALAVSRWTLDVIVRLAPEGIPHTDRIRVDGAAILFTGMAAIGAGLLFGLAPAIQVRARRLQEVLVSAGRGTVTGTHHRVRHVLVVAEIALSVILLIGASLLTHSLILVARVDPGFRPASVLTVDRVELPPGRGSAERSVAFYDRLLSGVQALPGVESAALTLGLPLDPRAAFFVDESPLRIEGRPPVAASERPVAPLHVVSAAYFSTMGVPLEQGRFFSDSDGPTAPAVVILNMAMARRLFPGESPIGRRLTHDLSIVPGQPTSREIVGVVGDIRHFGLQEAAEPQMFVPHAQMPWPSMALVIRTRLDAPQLGPAIRQLVRKLDPSIPVPPIRPMDEVVAGATAQPRFRAWVLGIFACVAVLLAITGLYGTMAYAAQQRTREVGVRMALGATPAQVTALLLRSGLQLAAAGTLLGLGGAAIAARLLASMLFGVSTFDPIAFAGGPALLFAAAGAACYLPAVRARRLDPLTAINADS